MRMTKKITSIVLAVMMVVSMMSVMAVSANAVGEVVPESDYLTFTAEEAGSSVTLKFNYGSNFKYNKNNSGWQSYTAGTQIELASAGDYVRFSGKDTEFNDYNHVSLTGKVACSGSVMSLRLSSGKSQGLSNYCFSYMFDGCAGLTTAPELPETLLANNCYFSMFRGCTSLTKAPVLPATTLARYCYSYMFRACENLTELPALPATTLADSCYYYMFYDCSNIRISDVVGTFDGITYSVEYRIPTTGTGTSTGNALYRMFYHTGGKFADTPDINTTYYLPAPAHTHDMTAHEAVAATCTTSGTSAYWECTDCGKFFSDEDGNNEIADIDAWLAEGGDGYVAALGHNKTHYAAQAATFDAEGNIEYWYCSRCEKYFSDENCENEITQAQTVTPVRAHEILSDADFAYAAANGGTDWYLKADVNADGVTVANNLKIWNTDKTHTISGDITIADGCEFAVAGKKTTNLTGKVTLAGQDSKATSLRTPEIILTQPYKSGQVYGSPASTIITYNGRKIIYDATSLTAAAKNGGEYYVVDDIAISGATTVKADLTITGLKEDGSTPVITVSAPTSAKPFCLFNLSSGVDITIENVDFAATLSNTKTVGVVSADLNSSAASYNTVTITDSEISGFSVSDGYGAVYLHGYTQAVLTNVEMSGNGKYDVWAGSEATVTIDGGSYETIFLHSYSGTGAVLDSTDATIGELELDNTVTTRLNATINSGTVTTITESGDGESLPAEVVVYDPANATVGAPDGYKWVDSEEAGMKTLVPKEYVAQVGETKYESLAEAYAAAADGDTITILDDIDLGTSKINIKKSVNFDLGGKTITGSGAAIFVVYPNKTVSIENGTVENTATTSNHYTIVGNASTVNLGDGAKLAGGYQTYSGAAGAVLNVNAGSTIENTTSFGAAIYNDAVLNVNGGTIKAAVPITTSGTSGNGGYEINITAGTVESTDEIAIYHVNDGTLNISGGTIKGGSEAAVLIKSGTTEISGGTFTSDGEAVKYATGSGYAPLDKIAISGGTFSSEVPEDFCANGFVPKDNGNGTYGVEPDTSNPLNPLMVAAGDINDGNLFGLTNDYLRGTLLGVQKKADSDDPVTSENGEQEAAEGDDLRFVAVLDTDLVQDADDYGFVLAKVGTNKNCANTNFDNLKVDMGNGEKTISAKGTYNTVCGDDNVSMAYGNPEDDSTDYKYVTCAVNGIDDSSKIVARFYYKKDGKTYYAKYAGHNYKYTGCTAGINASGNIY